MKYYELTLHVTPANEVASDILSALLGEIGYEAFTQTDDGLLAYVQQKDWNEEALKSVLTDFPLPDTFIDYQRKDAPDEDWNSAWEDTFRPIRIDDLVCIHDTRYEADVEVRYDIRITPKLAFGTGSHETTRMLLKALTEMELKGKEVVDAGTGTGILGILCAMREAKDVFAYDIDEWSVRNAEENATLNACEGIIKVVEGDASVLDVVENRDLVIANINRNILLADMPRFVKAMAAGGCLLLSGFYVDDAEVLVEKGKTLGLHEMQRWTDGEWCALLMKL